MILLYRWTFLHSSDNGKNPPRQEVQRVTFLEEGNSHARNWNLGSNIVLNVHLHVSIGNSPNCMQCNVVKNVELINPHSNQRIGTSSHHVLVLRALSRVIVSWCLVTDRQFCGLTKRNFQRSKELLTSTWYLIVNILPVQKVVLMRKWFYQWERPCRQWCKRRAISRPVFLIPKMGGDFQNKKDLSHDQLFSSWKLTRHFSNLQSQGHGLALGRAKKTRLRPHTRLF